MCNPPFYGSTSEIETSAEAKDLPPIAVRTLWTTLWFFFLKNIYVLSFGHVDMHRRRNRNDHSRRGDGVRIADGSGKCAGRCAGTMSVRINTSPPPKPCSCLNKLRRWFTSMLGKLASVGEVVRELRRRSVWSGILLFHASRLIHRIIISDRQLCADAICSGDDSTVGSCLVL